MLSALPAFASPVITFDPDMTLSQVSGNNQPGEVKLFFEACTTCVNFFANYGSQNGTPVFTFSTVGQVDVKQGFSTIDPSISGDFLGLTIVAPTGFAFTDIKFSLLQGPDFTLTGTGENEAFPHTLFDLGSIHVSNLPNGDTDWVDLDILGNNFPIEQLTLTADTGLNFKEIKQIEISGLEPLAPAVPEASTWVMLLLGFCTVGLAAMRKSRNQLIRLT